MLGKLTLLILMPLNGLLVLMDSPLLLKGGSVLILVVYAIIGVIETEFPNIGKDDL